MKTFLLTAQDKKFIINFKDFPEARYYGYNLICWARKVFDTRKVSIEHIKSNERNIYKGVKRLNYKEVLMHNTFLLKQMNEKLNKIREKSKKKVLITAVLFKDKTYYIKEGDVYSQKITDTKGSRYIKCTKFLLMCNNDIYKEYTFKKDVYEALKEKAVGLANTRIIFSDNTSY